MEEKKALNYLKYFSVITIGENKIPNHKWKEQQTIKLTEDELSKHLKKENTTGIGIVTGYDHLEVIDVDTKVFSTQSEMSEFWSEYYTTLKDSIINFDEKFVIYQTKSGGYHIIYKSKRVQGNTKIASLKGHNEAIIESRGLGGYIFLYPDKKINDKSYFNVDYISDEDREILWRISKSYNYIEDKPIEPIKNKKEYAESDIPPWTDFNNKTDIWSVISDEFSVPRNGVKSKHYLVKRHGASSPHSGYVFNDSGCLYLFTTGTIYPNEQLISPFVAYAYKFHNGDFKEATKDLYDQGFGSRLQNKIKELKPIIPDKIEFKNIEFPIDIFPKDIQFYINECASKLDSNVDFMGVSLVWLISICIGNSFEVEVKRGWNENGVVWVAVVGKAGIGKTPSINNIIHPLMKANSTEIKRYIKQMDDYRFYEGLTKKEKEDYPEVYEPVKTQFIANDITLEALVELHQESDNAVGVFKDELAGWFKDMNKYRSGSDLEFWLSCWSGKSVSMNRKTAKSSFVEKPFIPVLGGIQPAIFNSMSTEENKDNGFMDRMLLSFPDAKVEEYNSSELDYSTIKWYSDKITRFYETMQSLIKRNDEGGIIPIISKFSEEAKEEWVRIFNKITKKQNNEDENEYLKSMYPKQKSYIPRFALLINVFDSAFDESITVDYITKKSILKAEKLSDYFVLNAKKIKIDSSEINDLKVVSRKAETTSDKFKAIYKSDPNCNRTKVADLLGVSRQTVNRWVKQLENN